MSACNVALIEPEQGQFMTTDEKHDLAMRVHGLGSDIRTLLEIATQDGGREALITEVKALDTAHTSLGLVLSLCYAERRLKAVG